MNCLLLSLWTCTPCIQTAPLLVSKRSLFSIGPLATAVQKCSGWNRWSCFWILVVWISQLCDPGQNFQSLPFCWKFQSVWWSQRISNNLDIKWFSCNVYPCTTLSKAEVIFKADYVGQLSQFKFVQGSLHWHRLPSPRGNCNKWPISVSRWKANFRSHNTLPSPPQGTQQSNWNSIFSESTTWVSQRHFPACICCCSRGVLLGRSLNKANYLE